MGVDIWTQCKGINFLTSYKGIAWRLIQAQDNISTRKLVDSLEEHRILEELIDSTKPSNFDDSSNYHTLLSTPFRYPPLQYGSRFGKTTEHSLWYGSFNMYTAMAEKAFYQFNFLRASEAEFGTVELSLTAFSAHVQSDRMIMLTDSPFSDYKEIISSPVSYETSQILGSAMRKNNIEVFAFHSARDPKHGVNMALFTPIPFIQKKPDSKSFQSWQCIATTDLIEFIRSSSDSFEAYSFPLNIFLVENSLPFPAN